MKKIFGFAIIALGVFLEVMWLGFCFGSIIIGSVLFGLGLDYIFDITSVDPKSLIHMHEEVNIFITNHEAHRESGYK